MRNPSDIDLSENTTFVAENLDVVTIHERHWYNFPQFEPGLDIVHTVSPEWKEYRENTGLFQILKDFVTLNQPKKDIYLGIERGDVDFDQSSEVVFTVEPIEDYPQSYKVVSHTVKNGKVKHPSDFNSLILEILEVFRRRFSRLL